MYFDFHVFLFYVISMGEAPREQRRVRHTGRQEEKVSQLLVALLTQHAQVLGQYLIACVSEQHAVSTYYVVSGETLLI